MSVRQSNALCAAALLFAAACGGGGGDSSGAAPQPPVPTVATIELTLGAATLQAGSSTQAAATLRDSSGHVLTGFAVTWRSSNPTVAQVSSTGLVSALTAGTTTISVASQGKSASAELVVTAVPVEPVASVDVSLASTALHVGESTAATATARDAGGNALAGRSVTWSSSDAAVATVSATGLVTAIGVGSATISATSEGQSGSASLTATPIPVASVSVTLASAGIHVGEATQGSAVARDADGNILAGRAIVWSTSDAAVATVSATGLVTAVGVGSATISATAEGQSGSTSVTVTPVPVASVSVTLASASIHMLETTQATAVPRDAAGNTLTGRTVTWSTSDPAVATVSSTGRVLAGGVGTVTVSATCEGRVGSAVLTSTPVPVASVSVTLASSTLFVGQSTLAMAQTRDANGNLMARSVTWSTSDPAVATVSTDGLVLAVGPGSANITASSEGKSGSATFTALAPPAALRISVDPPATATVREALSRDPEVRLVNATGGDVARAGIAVTVQLAGGAGALTGTRTRLTDASGTAVFSGLSFTGLAAGTRSLLFTAPGLTAAASPDVQIAAGPPASVAAASALNQVAEPGAAVADPPAVWVRDLDGNAVPGAGVDFEVSLGGGAVSGSPATTDADGLARLSSWTLGPVGPQAVTATAPALPGAPLSFSATARAAVDQYDITLEFSPGTNATAGQREAFLRAKARLEAVVTGDLPAANIAAPEPCGAVTLTPGTVDDLVIVVELVPIDGVGTILGQAGPCRVRSGLLPYAGMMRFDTADLANMEAQGQLDAVILHEMMHVLGLGTLWSYAGLLSESAYDPVFLGANARAAFLGWNGGSFYSGIPVPVENQGNPGTVNVHWRETVFGRELMTGWISGTTQPMSRTTVESLRDLGYVVQAGSADPFDIGSAFLRAPTLDRGIDLTNDALPITIHEVDEQGRARPLAR